MKIAICDDEAKCVINLKKKLEAFQKREGVKIKFDIDCFTNPRLLLHALKNHIYDVVFLDIEMPEKDGFSCTKEIQNINPNSIIVFITKHKQFFMNSFMVNAFQYLVKPIDDDIFIQEMYRILNRYKSLNKTFVFQTNEEEKCYNAKEIIYLESNSKTYKLFTTDGTEYGKTSSIEKALKELEDHNFYRTHRSYIINFDHIAIFSGSSLTMSNGNVVPISKNKINEFKEEFFKHFE